MKTDFHRTLVVGQRTATVHRQSAALHHGCTWCGRLHNPSAGSWTTLSTTYTNNSSAVDLLSLGIKLFHILSFLSNTACHVWLIEAKYCFGRRTWLVINYQLLIDAVLFDYVKVSDIRSYTWQQFVDDAKNLCTWWCGKLIHTSRCSVLYLQ